MVHGTIVSDLLAVVTSKETWAAIFALHKKNFIADSEIALQSTVYPIIKNFKKGSIVGKAG